MVILGIDPGLAILGYGLIEKQGAKLTALDYGVAETQASMHMPARLERVYDAVALLIARFTPDCVAFEELFFYRNVSTALPIASARGVALLAASKAGLPMYEYTPMQIKQAVSGYGHAKKPQVQQMIKLLLNLKETPKPDDAADALAVCICHANIVPARWEEFAIN